MHEVITRRYRRVKSQGEDYPNLIVVDGGANQVNAALQALDKMAINIPVLGLVKDATHRTSSLYFNQKEFIINKNSDLFFFLEFLQNEVHRYAITYHHQVHSQNTFASALDNIPGIGNVRKRQILRLLTDEGGVNIESLRQLKLSEEQINAILKIFSSDR